MDGNFSSCFWIIIRFFHTLYICKFFFKEIIKEKFQSRFSNLTNIFKKNEFLYFFLYRLVGGIPFFIQNLLPTLFDIKLKNYFLELSLV